MCHVTLELYYSFFLSCTRHPYLAEQIVENRARTLSSQINKCTCVLNVKTQLTWLNVDRRVGGTWEPSNMFTVARLCPYNTKALRRICT